MGAAYIKAIELAHERDKLVADGQGDALVLRWLL